MTFTDLGKDGPHPDLTAALVERLNEEPLTEFREVDEVRVSDIQLLQRRTLYDLPWANLWGVPWGHESNIIRADSSVGLFMHAPSGFRKQLGMYWAHRQPDAEWGIAQMSINWLEEALKKPWPSIFFLRRGHGLAFGLLSPSAELGSLRVTLEDGSVHESRVSDDSALLFVPFHTEELWSSTIFFGFHDTAGQEIESGSYPLPTHPHPQPTKEDSSK